MNMYTLYSHNNGQLVKVKIFDVDQYDEALIELSMQTELFEIMNPNSNFEPFITRNNIIVAEGKKGDLDEWVKANKRIA